MSKSDQSAGSKTGSSKRRPPYVIRLLLALCLVELGLILLLWWPAKAPRATDFAPHPARPGDQAPREPYFAGRPGPWGELEYIRINLELPEEFVDGEEQIIKPTRWFFPATSREQLNQFFATCNLNDAQRAELNDARRWVVEPDGLAFEPSGDLILTLAQETRTAIYSRLAQSKRNDYHAAPFAYRHGGLDDWLGNSGLSEATRELVKRVVYQRGAALCVSDLPELSRRIVDPTERRRLIKALSRASALLMKVRVRPDTDTRALTAYWGQGWHVKDIGPLLESLTKVTNSISIDVVHLLPPFARKRVNSYPTPLAPGQRAPDCYWSAFNFCNDPPDDRYFDDSVWRRELQEKYQLVEQPTFGDLVFLTRPDGVPIHCAVFIADDVVFTKNGANPRQPWKLMKLEDMLARYPENYPLNMAFFHLRQPGP